MDFNPIIAYAAIALMLAIFGMMFLVGFRVIRRNLLKAL